MQKREDCNLLHCVQGWHSGESTCYPPLWPRFNFHTGCHMWVEFVGTLGTNQHLI